jgi:hypothetical protein
LNIESAEGGNAEVFSFRHFRLRWIRCSEAEQGLEWKKNQAREGIILNAGKSYGQPDTFMVLSARSSTMGLVSSMDLIFKSCFPIVTISLGLKFDF